MNQSRPVLRTSVLVIFISFFILLLGNGPQATAAVTLTILNEPTPGTPQIVVTQGDPIEVEFEVTFGDDTSPRDLIQLRRLDSGEVVSEEMRGDRATGIVLLSTEPENALGELEVVYILATTGAVLATADQTVLVVEDSPPEPPSQVVFPSSEAPTLQAAIDLVANGGTVRIKGGAFEITEPIYVVGRKVTIKGTGRGSNSRIKATRLVGPPPSPVVVERNAERNTVIPLAEDLVGLFNIVAADVVIENMKLTGFDATIVCRDNERNEFGSTTVRNVDIADTGRGILSFSSGLLTVDGCSFASCSWNGISVVQNNPLFKALGLETYESSFINPQGAGIYLSNAFGIVHNANISGAWTGGIVAYQSRLVITSCQITNNLHSGITMYESNLFPIPSTNIIQNNLIANTYPDFNGNFGDGICLVLSDCSVINNAIAYSSRTGISNFGSHVPIANTYLTCQPFDLQGETFQGTNFDFDDLGGNFCQCGGPPEGCQVTSSTLQAPEMLGGLE
jgi:hypothetical protein